MKTYTIKQMLLIDALLLPVCAGLFWAVFNYDAWPNAVVSVLDLFDLYEISVISCGLAALSAAIFLAISLIVIALAALDWVWRKLGGQ